MKCEEVKINLPEYIDRKLDKATREMVETHLADCRDCKAQHDEMKSFLAFMSSVPEPEVPEDMKEEFAGMLASLNVQEKKKVRLMPTWAKVAASVVLVLGTYWLGYKTGTHRSETVQNELTSEISTQKQQVLLASLRDYTGPQKIEAVYNISNAPKVNDDLIDALVYTMNSDKNTNVRLAAITALSGMMEKHQRIKTELIKSLAIQENPLLQISLIQVLTEKGIKEAKEPIENITKSDKTDESVKAFAKDMMKTII